MNQQIRSSHQTPSPTNLPIVVPDNPTSLPTNLFSFPFAEQNGKSSLDFDFQYEYRPWKRDLSILFALEVLPRVVSYFIQTDFPNNTTVKWNF